MSMRLPNIVLRGVRTSVLRCSALRTPVLRSLRQLSSVPVTPVVSATSSSDGLKALDIAKEVLRSRARGLAGGVALAAGGLLYLWSTEREDAVVADMFSVFEAGGVAGWDDGFFNDARASVERPDVEADLASILRPSVVDKYAVIVGPSGTGKSTAVRKVIRALIAEGVGAGMGAGIVYFTTTELITDFSRNLRESVGFREPIDLFDSCYRLFTRETKEQASAPLQIYEPRATWSSLAKLLKKAAMQYKKEHGKAPTLVLDAMDLVAKKDSIFFCEVQDFAKACADAGIMRVVFIFSDGDALPLLLSSSAESRCDTDQVYEVGDISDADAVKFVVSRYGKDEQLAKELVETITGGRFTLLQNYGKSAKTLNAIRKVLDIKTNTKLRSAGVSLTHPMLKSLAASATLEIDVAEEMLEPSKISKLLLLNILAVHPNGTYTFNSRHVKAHIQRELERRVAGGEEEAHPA
jgi:hypothetical protein